MHNSLVVTELFMTSSSDCLIPGCALMEHEISSKTQWQTRCFFSKDNIACPKTLGACALILSSWLLGGPRQHPYWLVTPGNTRSAVSLVSSG